MKNSNTHHSGSWFIVVGATSTIVHYIVAVSLAGLTILNPEYCNIIGFSFAFPVSYFGHKKISFRHHNTHHLQSLPRFMMIAVAGFSANQSLVMFSQRLSTVPFWISLAVIMMFIALSTYLLSRFWAFRHH